MSFPVDNFDFDFPAAFEPNVPENPGDSVVDIIDVLEESAAGAAAPLEVIEQAVQDVLEERSNPSELAEQLLTIDPELLKDGSFVEFLAVVSALDESASGIEPVLADAVLTNVLQLDRSLLTNGSVTQWLGSLGRDFLLSEAFNRFLNNAGSVAISSPDFLSFANGTVRQGKQGLFLDGSFNEFLVGLGTSGLTSSRVLNNIDRLPSALLTTSQFASFLTSLAPKLLFDGSFARFLAAVNAGPNSDLLKDDAFLEAIATLNPDLLTSDRVLDTISSLGLNLLKNEPFRRFLSSLSRETFDDGSFTEFLKGLSTRQLIDGSFTQFLSQLGESRLTNGAFTEALSNLDPSLLTQSTVTELFAAVGLDLVASAPFAMLVASLSDEVIADEGFTDVLQTLEASVLGDEDFSRLLPQLSDEVLGSSAFQGLLTQIDAELLISEDFTGLLAELSETVLTDESFTRAIALLSLPTTQTPGLLDLIADAPDALLASADFANLIENNFNLERLILFLSEQPISIPQAIDVAESFDGTVGDLRADPLLADPLLADPLLTGGLIADAAPVTANFDPTTVLSAFVDDPTAILASPLETAVSLLDSGPLQLGASDSDSVPVEQLLDFSLLVAAESVSDTVSPLL